MPTPGDVLKIDAGELRALGWLLGAPCAESLELLADWQRHLPWLAPALSELSAISLEDWQAEHTRLFLNGFPRTPCPPFASPYLGEGMCGAIMTQLAAYYQDWGLDWGQVPPDYLGNLLECLALHMEQAQPELTAHFLDRYVRPWLPRFAADLQQAAQLELYRALGTRLLQLAPSI